MKPGFWRGKFEVANAGDGSRSIVTCIREAEIPARGDRIARYESAPV